MLMVAWLLAGYSPRDFGTICQEVEVCCPIQELQMATMSMAMVFGQDKLFCCMEGASMQLFLVETTKNIQYNVVV